MVFLDLIHMLMMIPNLVLLFMRLPLIPFDFCLSYQLLTSFSAHGRGGRQARREEAEEESKCSKGVEANRVGGRHL